MATRKQSRYTPLHMWGKHNNSQILLKYNHLNCILNRQDYLMYSLNSGKLKYLDSLSTMV